jgi:tetratricopeptide (TPR) repeat protein
MVPRFHLSSSSGDVPLVKVDGLLIETSNGRVSGMTKTLQVCLLFVCFVTVNLRLTLGQEPAARSAAAVQAAQQTEATQPAVVGPREATFKEATEAFKRANELEAGLLSPKYFSEARKSYQKAMEIYDRGGKLADVRANLSKCMQDLELATKTAEVCQVALKDLLTVRSEAIATGYSFDRSNDFRDAGKKLQQAAQKVEKGDLKGAQNPSRQASEGYRKAVLQVMEKQLIPDSKQKLKNLKRTYTKEDYKRAENALKDLERQVKSQKNVSFSIVEFNAHVRDEIEQALKPRAPAAQGTRGGE